MEAILIGATGATGKDLLKILLADERYSSVKVFTRRPSGTHHPKLAEHLIEFGKPDSWAHLVKGDVLFSCLGTTLKLAGSKEAQYLVDYTYQYHFAKAARANGVPAVALVSSGGADAQSAIFYLKMKGELEEAITQLGFNQTMIFRPPLLIRKNSDRASEKWGRRILPLLNRLGLFKSQQPVTTDVLAQKMANRAMDSTAGLHLYSGHYLSELKSPN